MVDTCPYCGEIIEEEPDDDDETKPEKDTSLFLWEVEMNYCIYMNKCSPSERITVTETFISTKAERYNIAKAWAKRKGRITNYSMYTTIIAPLPITVSEEEYKLIREAYESE